MNFPTFVAREVHVALVSSPGKPVSRVSFAVSVTLAMIAITVVSFCFARRFVGLASFRGWPLARWLILAIYTDSWLFIFSSTVLQTSFGLNSNLSTCDWGILLCLICYTSSKVLVYMFLVEKVHIIHGNRHRWSDRLYLFNIFGILMPYCVVIVLGFIFRYSTIESDGQCSIGLKLPANISLLSFDITINIYLTYLFLKPLRGLWSFKNGTGSKQSRLRRVALRTFIGSCVMLGLTFANLASLLILGREPGWVCLACCNSDILFSVLCLHWVTHQDEDVFESSKAMQRRTCCAHGSNSGTGRHRPTDYANLGIDEAKGGFGGQVITNCEALKGKHTPIEIPLEGIMTQTEFTRDVESMGNANSSVDSVAPDIRANSTDFIHESQT